MNTNTALTAVFAKTSTATLVQSALILEAQDTYAEGERLTLAWISDELTERMGGIVDDEAFDTHLDNGLTYLEALLVTFPALVA